MARDTTVTYDVDGRRFSAGVYQSRKVAKKVFELLADLDTKGEFKFDYLEIYEVGPCPQYYEGWRNHKTLGRIPFG